MPVMSTYHPEDEVSTWQRLLRADPVSCPSNEDISQEKKERKFNLDIVI